MRFSIDQKLLERVLNYVATKPYNEVAQLLSEVQRDVKAIEEIPAEKTQEKA